MAQKQLQVRGVTTEAVMGAVEQAEVDLMKAKALKREAEKIEGAVMEGLNKRFGKNKAGRIYEHASQAVDVFDEVVTAPRRPTSRRSRAVLAQSDALPEGVAPSIPKAATRSQQTKQAMVKVGGVPVADKYAKEARKIYEESVGEGPDSVNPFTTPSRRQTWRVRVWEAGREMARGQMERQSAPAEASTASKGGAAAAIAERRRSKAAAKPAAKKPAAKKAAPEKAKRPVGRPRKSQAENRPSA